MAQRTPPTGAPTGGAQPGGGVALIYTRVSGPGQERDGESLESQEALCRELAARLGYTVGLVIHEVFRGEELFGRPQLHLARADLRARRYDALLVWTPDRLARNPVHQAIVIEEVTRAGARVEFVREPLDTSPEGMFLAFAKGFGSQMEIGSIRARSLGGKVRRAQNGKLPRAGHDLYGYQRHHDTGTRTIEETQAQIVRRLFDWCTVENWGLGRMARALEAEGVPTPGAAKFTFYDGRTPHWQQKTIKHILTHPAYKGETASFRYRTEVIIPDPERPRRAQYRTLLRAAEEQIALPAGVTPPIVTVEQWELAQVMLRARRLTTAARNSSETHLLRGRVTCGVCQRPMYVEWRHHKRYAYYRCSSKLNTGVVCGGSLIIAGDLDTWVWQEVSALLSDPTLLERELGAASQAQETDLARTVLAEERAKLTAEVARVERLRARTLARYNAVDNEAVLPWSVVEAELARLERERVRAAQRLDDLTEHVRIQTISQQRMQRAVAHLQRVYGQWQQAVAPTFAERVTILEALQVGVIGNGATWRLLGRLTPAADAPAASAASVAPSAEASTAGMFVRVHQSSN